MTVTSSHLDPRRVRAVLDRVVADADVAVHPHDRVVVRRAVARALAAEGVVLAPTAWARTVRDLVDDLVGLGPVEPLLRDPTVTDVCVNGPDQVWVERGGVMERTDVAFTDDEDLLRAVRRVLAAVGRRLDRGQPWVDARIAGGVRLHAVLPPLAVRPLVTLRRVPSLVPTWDQLEVSGSVPAGAREVLLRAVVERRNLVLVGQAGSGKTTLLTRLLHHVGDDRVVVIEDTPELGHPGRHVVTLQTDQPSADGVGGADMELLVRQALRMRPDRLVVGEVRGREVAALLQAMNTGHQGSMTTVHANSAADALVRLEGMALLAGTPLAAATAQLDAAVDVVVHLDRPGGRRRVARIAEVQGPPRALVTRWSP